MKQIIGACFALALINTPIFGQNSSPKIDEEYKSLETLARGLYYLETMYVAPEKVKRSTLTTNALKGIVTKLDPHTVLMPAKAFEQLTIDTKGKFGGVGIIVSSEKNKLIVIQPIEETPAATAGILPGDEIIKIDGKEVTKFKKGEATEAMRGSPGSTLTLTIKREGSPKHLEFELKREIIQVKSVRSMPLAEKILYVRIASFQDETADELKAALDKHKPSKGLILDLRDNPGGLLDQAIYVSDLFISSGVIVSTVGRDSSDIEREFAHLRGTYKDFPIIVLINAGSASASEIVAGAIQDHQRGIILGTTSFGKGSVQTLVSLPDGSGLKITVARYYTPNDRSIQAKGIIPDIMVDAKKHASNDKTRKEQDLKGHISGDNLSDLGKNSGLFSASRDWPEYAKKDHQLLTAFTYLQGWGVLKNKEGKPTKP